jgi:hypothetical protein
MSGDFEMGTEPEGLVARLRTDAYQMKRADTATQLHTWGMRLARSAKVAADRIEELEAQLKKLRPCDGDTAT